MEPNFMRIHKYCRFGMNLYANITMNVQISIFLLSKINIISNLDLNWNWKLICMTLCPAEMYIDTRVMWEDNRQHTTHNIKKHGASERKEIQYTHAMETRKKAYKREFKQYSGHDEAWVREIEPPNPINQVAASVLSQGHEVRLIVPARDNKPCNHPSLLHKLGNYLPIPDRHFRKGKIHLTSSPLLPHTATVDTYIHTSTYVKEKLKVCMNKEVSCDLFHLKAKT